MHSMLYSSKTLSACCRGIDLLKLVMLLGSHCDAPLHCHWKKFHMPAEYLFIHDILSVRQLCYMCFCL